MAEKFCDVLAPKLGNTAKCRTAEEDLVPAVSEADKKAARQYFPSYGVNLAATRLGTEKFPEVVKTLKENPETREVLCECENVTMAEVMRIAQEPTSHSVADVRRRTRLGMGTCQGNYCAIRSAAIANKLFKNKLEGCGDSLSDMKNFLQARWKGITPVMAGKTLREDEMTRGMYEVLFNVNGGRR
jgi:glycerol-3-phosphate dehydrogenase